MTHPMPDFYVYIPWSSIFLGCAFALVVSGIYYAGLGVLFPLLVAVMLFPDVDPDSIFGEWRA